MKMSYRMSLKLYKFIQRLFYNYLNTWIGFTSLIIIGLLGCVMLLTIASVLTENIFYSNTCNSFHGFHCSVYNYYDNIGNINSEQYLAYEPIDVVYTWVNGSDPIWLKKKQYYASMLSQQENNDITLNPSHNDSSHHSINQIIENHSADTIDSSHVLSNHSSILVDSNSSNNNSSNNNSNANDSIISLNMTTVTMTRDTEDDTDSGNRYRDNMELKYSLRSLIANAPWIRRIYLITDNQIPYWLNLENKNRLIVLSHEDIFQNKSVLPVFSSPAIESQLHHIPNLSNKFIYFNDDVMLGSTIYPDDFISLSGIQKLYMSWDVPKCNPGCNENWIGDGACDKACNVPSCNYDYPDCIAVNNGTANGSNMSNRDDMSNTKRTNFCSKGCPDSWLGDKVCDQKCNVIECGYDIGDCGIDRIIEEERYKSMKFSHELYWNNQHMITISNIQSIDSQSYHTIEHNHTEYSNTEYSNTDHNNTVFIPILPIVLTVPMDSLVFYMNMSYLRCLSTTNPVLCPQEELLGYKYTSAQSIHSMELLQTSILVHKYHILVGILYHEQEGAPVIPTLPYDIQYTVTGSNSITNISISASFIVRIVDKPNKIKGWNTIVPIGMGTVKGYVSKCHTSHSKIKPVTMTMNDIDNKKKKEITETIAEQISGVFEEISDYEVELSSIPYRIKKRSIEQQKEQEDQEEGVVVRIERDTSQSSYNIFQNVSIDDLYITILSSYHHTKPNLKTTTTIQLNESSSRDSTSHQNKSNTQRYILWKSKLCYAIIYPILSNITNMIAYESYSVHLCKEALVNYSYHIIRIPTPIGKSIENWEEAYIQSNGSWIHSNILLTYEPPGLVRQTTNRSYDSFVGRKSKLSPNSMDVPLNEWIEWPEDMNHYKKQLQSNSHNNNNVNILLCLSTAYHWGSNIHYHDRNNSDIEEREKSSISLIDQNRRLYDVNDDIISNISNNTNFITELMIKLYDYLLSYDIDNNHRPYSNYHADRNPYFTHQRRKLMDTYASSLIYVSKLYTKRFGYESRKVPAHMPHMIDKHFMSELQSLWPNEWNDTMSHRFRSTNDMQYAFAYYYYLIHRNNAIHSLWNRTKIDNFIDDTVDVEKSMTVMDKFVYQFIVSEIDRNRDGYVDDNEMYTLATIVWNRSPSIKDISYIIQNCSLNIYDRNISDNHQSNTIGLPTSDKAYSKTFQYKFGNIRKSYELIHSYLTIYQLSQCHYLRNLIGLDMEVEIGVNRDKDKSIDWNSYKPIYIIGSDKDKDSIAFEMIGDNETETIHRLDSIRRRITSGVKFICINDNMKNPSNDLIEKLKLFYEAMYPIPSIFELPENRQNPTLYLDEYRDLYQKKSHKKNKIRNRMKNIYFSGNRIDKSDQKDDEKWKKKKGILSIIKEYILKRIVRPIKKYLIRPIIHNIIHPIRTFIKTLLRQIWNIFIRLIRHIALCIIQMILYILLNTSSKIERERKDSIQNIEYEYEIDKIMRYMRYHVDIDSQQKNTKMSSNSNIRIVNHESYSSSTSSFISSVEEYRSILTMICYGVGIIGIVIVIIISFRKWKKSNRQLSMFHNTKALEDRDSYTLDENRKSKNKMLLVDEKELSDTPLRKRHLIRQYSDDDTSNDNDNQTMRPSVDKEVEGFGEDNEIERVKKEKYSLAHRLVYHEDCDMESGYESELRNIEYSDELHDHDEREIHLPFNPKSVINTISMPNIERRTSFTDDTNDNISNSIPNKISTTNQGIDFNEINEREDTGYGQEDLLNSLWREAAKKKSFSSSTSTASMSLSLSDQTSIFSDGLHNKDSNSKNDKYDEDMDSDQITKLRPSIASDDVTFDSKVSFKGVLKSSDSVRLAQRQHVRFDIPDDQKGMMERVTDWWTNRITVLKASIGTTPSSTNPNVGKPSKYKD